MKLPWLIGLFSIAAFGSLAATAHASAHTYWVKSDCRGKTRCFPAIQSALDASLTDANTGWVTIDIAPGQYHEKLIIQRAKTVLRGHGRDRTHIEYNAVAETAGRYHRNNWGTPGSATLTVESVDIVIRDLTVENSFDFLANDSLLPGDPKKIANSQGLAMLADIHSDRVTVLNASLIGYQDTLFANGKRVFVRKSLISGNIDFIFGNGQVLIEDSTIQSRRRAAEFKPDEFQSFVTAPSTPLAQDIGIVIYRSRLTREAGVPDGSVALGRPWHPTTTFADGRYADPNAVGQAIFIDCFMDAHIRNDHWTEMNGTAHDGTKTARFMAQDSRFAETGSYGPGSVHTNIGIKWKAAPDITLIRSQFFAHWPSISQTR